MKKNLQFSNFVRNFSNPLLERNSEKLSIEKNEILKPEIRVTLKKFLLNTPLSEGENTIVSALIYKSYIYARMNGYIYNFALKANTPACDRLLRLNQYEICSNFIVRAKGFMHELTITGGFKGSNYTIRNAYYNISEALNLKSYNNG